jgi:mycothiol synthase
VNQYYSAQHLTRDKNELIPSNVLRADKALWCDKRSVFAGGNINQMSKEPFTTRSATLNDVEAIVDLINACSTEAGIEERDTEENIRASMQMPGLNLETDTLLVMDQEGQIVGLAFVQDDHPSPLLTAAAEVHPKHRGKGVGTTLCQWIEERAREAIPRLPAEARVAVLQKRSSEDEDSKRLLLEQGYQVARHYFNMVIEMDRPPSKPTKFKRIKIRPFIRDEEGQALIQAIREAFRDNWGYIERPFEVDYQRWMHILDSDGDPEAARYWFVAIEESEIVGFVLSRLQMNQSPEDAWIYIVGVRPAWRRQGIALALLQHSLWRLYQYGKRRIRLEVDARSRTGATRLYEKAGMRVERSYDLLEKELRPGKI